jgi:hypothetical protein
MPENTMPPTGATDVDYVQSLADGLNAMRHAILEIGQHVQALESEFTPLKQRYEILESTCKKFLDEWEQRALEKLREDGIAEIKGKYKDNAEYNDLVGKIHELADLKSYGYEDGWSYIYDLLDEARREAEQAKEQAGDNAQPFEEGKFLDGVFGSIKDKMKKIADAAKKELPEAAAVQIKAAIPEDEKMKAEADEAVRIARKLRG